MVNFISNTIASDSIANDLNKNKYDSKGILVLNNGVKILSTELSGVDTIVNAINYLGYGLEELYFAGRTNDGIYGGLYEIISGQLVCILRGDAKVMTELEVSNYSEKYFEKQDCNTLERHLDDGIENKSIRKCFIESVLKSTASEDTLIGVGYIFFFKEDRLFKYSSSTGYNANVRDYFTDLDLYYQEATRYYGDNDDLIKLEINLQADCFTRIPLPILKDVDTCMKFSYPNGPINYIAMALNYKLIDVELSTFVHSTHSKWETVSDYPIQIQAYGNIFEF